MVTATHDDNNDDDHPQGDYHLHEAVASHYARQQQGLPPLPDTLYIRIPHRRWLRECCPIPRPPGG